MVSDHAALKYILNDPLVFIRSHHVRRISWVLTGKDGIFSVLGRLSLTDTAGSEDR